MLEEGKSKCVSVTSRRHASSCYMGLQGSHSETVCSLPVSVFLLLPSVRLSLCVAVGCQGSGGYIKVDKKEEMLHKKLQLDKG